MRRFGICLITISIAACTRVASVAGPQGGKPSPHARGVDQVVDELVTDGRRDRVKEAYQARTGQARLSSAMAAVARTCIEKYHRDSCLHHFIKCGEACRPLLSDQRYAALRAEYWRLMKERGLTK